MNYSKNILFFLIAILLWFPGNSYSIPAFPGAEGFGVNSVGGRGGNVIKVTNLNDSGPGSFREAVTASGPRIVVFEVSGIINLESEILLSNPYITIAGETSPGGILIAKNQLKINTHDVIMRHMRFRLGTDSLVYDRDGDNNIIYYDVAQWAWPPEGGSCKGNVTTKELGYPCVLAGGADPETLDTFNVWGKNWAANEAYNIIIDHCSFSWGVDETFSITGGVKDTTVQWSIVSEGLSRAGHPKGEHSKGLLVSGKYRYDNAISLHHNYIAHNADRNPQIYSPQDAYNNTTLVDVVNNVTYNWHGGLSPHGQEIPRINWIHNYAKPGQNSHSWSYEVTHYAKEWSIEPRPLIYVEGNIGSSRLSQEATHWNVGWYYWNQLANTTWQKSTPWKAPLVTTTTMSDSIASCILSSVGATAPVRDSVDTRVITDFFAGTGKIIMNVKYPDNYPTFQAPPPPADTDNDGMADSWELLKGFNVGSNDSALDSDNNGYTNIEEYLHYLSNKSYTFNAACMPDPNADRVAPSPPTIVMN